MATVYLGRVRGAVGFGRTVAIKVLHPHLARDPELVSRFVDEAHIVARVHHPNVVPTLDVVAQEGEIFLVLEYVKGESLAGLLRASVQTGRSIPVPMALSMIVGALNGLHAAHEVRDERGVPLHIVHRDVSPHNILVGIDGAARLLDFGVAKAAHRLAGTTRDGQLKGKVPYMAPEQLAGAATRQTDIYATGVVLWETLTCSPLFRHENELQLFHAILSQELTPPSAIHPGVPAEVDRIVMKALARNPAQRYATALQMAQDIDACADVASSMKVAEWVQAIAGPALAVRSALVSRADLDATPPAHPHPNNPNNPNTDTPHGAREEAPSVVTAPSVAVKLPSTAPRPSTASRVLWALSGGGVLLILAGLGVASFALRSSPRTSPPSSAGVDAAIEADRATQPASASPAPSLPSGEPVATAPPSAPPARPDTGPSKKVPGRGTKSTPSATASERTPSSVPPMATASGRKN